MRIVVGSRFESSAELDSILLMVKSSDIKIDRMRYFARGNYELGDLARAVMIGYKFFLES